ncbi:tigger transposable element-derived protein 6 [Plakobranchus ocellatus]|uniref:Tigger transposable element-derived protein 6 n=1 Tax=Plakobranchus ocellatus TaxID=259542 RepID=A0AAV4ABB6_9GAST|nr:tigger transposable element-derived protein 6 [Plakobranchus ocellatus]
MVEDNLSAYLNVDVLRSIKPNFLSPNTTSHLQPCDQGIINFFKRVYGTQPVRKYVDHSKDKVSSASTQPTSSETFRISVLYALYDMRAAWDKVTEQTTTKK